MAFTVDSGPQSLSCSERLPAIPYEFRPGQKVALNRQCITPSSEVGANNSSSFYVRHSCFSR